MRPSSPSSVSRMGRRGQRSPAELLARKLLARLAEHRMAARRGVLHVEDRIVLGLLGHLGEVEVERRVVLAVEHHEADRVAADLLHHLAQRDEVAGALSTSDRLATPEELYELAEQQPRDRPSRRTTALASASIRLT